MSQATSDARAAWQQRDCKEREQEAELLKWLADNGRAHNAEARVTRMNGVVTFEVTYRDGGIISKVRAVRVSDK